MSEQEPDWRQRKKNATRERIRASALRLFGEQGYDATTVEQIAADAGVSHMTFFRYFPAKEDVALSDSYHPLIASFIAQTPATWPLARRIRTVLVQGLRQIYGAERDALLAQNKLIVSTPVLRERLWARQISIQELILAALSASGDGAPPGFADRVTVAACLAAATTAILTWVDSDGTPDLPDLVEQAFDTLTALAAVDRPRWPGLYCGLATFRLSHNTPKEPRMTATNARAAARYADVIRLRAVRMVAPHGFGYLGQALSSAELFATLYSGHYDPGRDSLVVSPGHYIIAAFAAAPEAGLLEEEALASYGFDESALEAIGTERSPAVDLTCGSLGMGLSGAAGLALADRLQGREGARVYAILSDGELEEGQVWEAALFAAHNRLGMLTVLLDANDSQVDGPVSSITTLEPIAGKWESFGWAAFDVDGHDTAALHTALSAAAADPRPAVVIARTSVTHGLTVLPDGADGHFIKLPAPLAEAAIRELEARLA